MALVHSISAKLVRWDVRPTGIDAYHALAPTKSPSDNPTRILVPRSFYHQVRMPVAQEEKTLSQTLGQRYFVISFRIAKSAFRCSLLETIGSLRSGSADADCAGFAGFDFSMVSGTDVAAFPTFVPFKGIF